MSGEASRANVLVVDDEPEVVKIISINLEIEGYEARVAYNGRQALDEVESRKPDCILLDIMMPEMDGWEVLRRLKEDPSTADIPVVVVTARSSDIDRIKGFSGGAVEYIIKPFEPKQLLDYVKKALRPKVEELEEEIRQDRIRRLQLSTIYDITEALISTLEINEVLEIVAKRLLLLFGLDLCAVSLLEPSGRSLRLASIRSTSSLVQEDHNLFSISLQDLKKILKADPANLSRPQYVPTSFFAFMDDASKLSRLASMYILPMRAKGKFTGVIYLGKKDNMKLGEEELELLSAIGNEAAMAIENTRLYDDLRYDEEVHKQLLQRVITAQEDERRRMAIELHDGVVQNIVSALFRLQLCSARLENAPDEVHEALQEAQDMVNKSIEEMRRIITGLRPTLLDDLGLVMALRKYIRILQEKAPYPFKIELVEQGTPALTPEAETALFRIAQEGLNNILKHSRCSNASLSLGIWNGELLLKIEDDGVGFEPRGIQHRDTHSYGLVGMRERAESLGGSLEITTATGEGTRITAHFPLSVVQEEA